MKRIILLIMILFVAFACTKELYPFALKGVAPLKDNTFIKYEFEIIFGNPKGASEMERKVNQINHAIRIIMAQRGHEQLKNAARLKTVLSKILKSQLKYDYIKIKVNSFDLGTQF